MHITVISQDDDVYQLCKGCVSELPEAGIRLSRVSSIPEADVEADLYILDFQPDLSLPEQILGNSANTLLLTHRSHLAYLRTKVATEFNILLKPVSRPTRFVFLRLAVLSRTPSSLRADRDRFLQCLIETNLKLQEYDQDRTNFLARVLHDFRAPLTALSGYCGLLLDESLGSLNENQKEVIQRMQNSTKRLSRMASAMFELSVRRVVKKPPERQAGDVRKCLDQALYEIAPFADEKRITITSELTPCEEELYFEAGQIDQVFLNILDNACRFTPRGGVIEIRGYSFFWEGGGCEALTPPRPGGANSYRIDIRDSGGAIPQEHLADIFEEYTSYSGGKDRSGGGLGLAICRMIVSQHEGHIWAENTDQGPMFSFVLPVHQVTGLPSKLRQVAAS
jgi:signal transduction histidine kinase